MTRSGRIVWKNRVDWFDGGLIGWSVVCFVVVSPCSLSYLLLMSGKWKESFFKTSDILLCIEMF